MRVIPIRPHDEPKRIALRAVTKGGAVHVELEEVYDRTPGVVWLSLDVDVGDRGGLSPDFCGCVTAPQLDELIVLLLRAQARARAAGILPAVARRAAAPLRSPHPFEAL